MSIRKLSFTTPSVEFRGLGHAMARVLIASYFIASAFGLVVETHGDAVITVVLPNTAGATLASVIEFTLGYMILTGTQVRTAALLLSLYVLWSSFIANYVNSVTPSLDDFWRDLALIGGLLMTYSHDQSEAREPSRVRRGRPAFARRVTPRRIRPATAGAAERTARPAADEAKAAEVGAALA